VALQTTMSDNLETSNAIHENEVILQKAVLFAKKHQPLLGENWSSMQYATRDDLPNFQSINQEWLHSKGTN